MRRSSLNAAIAAAAPASAENTAATGLESAVMSASATAGHGRRRCSASAVATAGSIPKANVSRPV